MSDAIPYNGIHGKFVGDGHVDHRTRACMECGQRMGNYHKDGCSEAYRDLSQKRPTGDAFTLGELLIIEELSGYPFQGTFWGGYGDSVTDEEVQASAPNPAARRYLPPPTRTLQEAIGLVKAYLSEGWRSDSVIRAWATERGLPVGARGRLPAELRAHYFYAVSSPSGES